jgi:acetyl esterase/lipase
MRAIAVILLLALSAAAAADDVPVAAQPVLDDRYPARRVELAGGVSSWADLTYSTPLGFRPLTLDLYRPSRMGDPLPLVVYVHGGGWQSGHTRHAGAFENWPAVLAALAAKGYVVVSQEYRLSGEARFPAAIDDVRAAIRWLRARAGEYGIDRSRAVIWGGSAGGQLAALATMDCQRAEQGAESACVQGLIAWYGIFDFSLMGATPADAAPSRYLGCSPCDAAKLAAASPATFIDSSDPPVLLIHGVQDRTVPIQQSREFVKSLRAKGVKVELVEIPGVDHSFIGPNLQATQDASREALRRSFEFIDRTMAR